MDQSVFPHLRQRLRSAMAWRTYRPATEAVDVDELISPLRYDIMVRADFFDYLSERFDQYEEDFDRFAADATATPYYSWFTKVALVRYRPREAADRLQMTSAFRQRLRRSGRLVASFNAGGFDVRHPISVRTAQPGARTGTGKLVSRRYYAGDGCHRLALLVRSGMKTLPPSYYRVRRDPESTVIDNTQLLIRELRLTPEQYYRFLSRGYADRAFPDALSLQAHVAEHSPHRLTELKAVIAADEQAFPRPSSGAPLVRSSDRRMSELVTEPGTNRSGTLPPVVRVTGESLGKPARTTEDPPSRSGTPSA